MEEKRHLNYYYNMHQRGSHIVKI